MNCEGHLMGRSQYVVTGAGSDPASYCTARCTVLKTVQTSSVDDVTFLGTDNSTEPAEAVTFTAADREAVIAEYVMVHEVATAS